MVRSICGAYAGSLLYPLFAVLRIFAVRAASTAPLQCNWRHSRTEMEVSGGQIDALTEKQASAQAPTAATHQQEFWLRDEPSYSQKAALYAATSGPRRRNRPADSSPRQKRRRLRQTYADYSTLPAEWQDNEFITTGYRGTQLGAWDSIKSLFGLHNETGNIWTHLIGNHSTG